MISRRNFLVGTTAAVAVGGAYTLTQRSTVNADSVEQFELARTSDEWQKILSPAQFSILREQSTERPYTSPLLAEKRAGTFHCAGCDLPTYRSETKYESGTGWPSFYQSIAGAVATTTDYKLLYPRTEVHCRRCGGHFGHIFDDGPKPTGKRHCLNGLALKFVVDI